jgi:hypothetical protein
VSDFDAVLERLVTDPAFAAALAADPATALAGYRLDAGEAELLRSQVTTGDGGGRTVETRTSKASMAGLLSGLALGGSGGGTALGRGLAAHHPREGFGTNAPAGMSLDGGEGVAAGRGTGAAESAVPGAGDQFATDYHAHVDADGDGHWDRYVAVRHPDGGVDVYEDRNGDGRIDFIGHDANGDGILESADYDNDFDGTTDTRLVDTDGDGWMDRRVPPRGN